MKRALLNPRVVAVIENEWAQLLRNKIVIFTTIAPPTLLVLLAIAVLILSTFIDGNISKVSGAAAALVNGGDASLHLVGSDAVRAALLSPFLVLFQMIPLIVPITVASYSIVGEKQSRSLEALLATPIRTWELLLGKALSAAIPGVLATWYSFLIFALVARATLNDALFLRVVLSPTWLLSILVLAPLFTLLAVSLGILISTKVKDAQSAQQVGSLLIVPLVGALVAQVSGAVSVDAGVVAGTAAGIFVLDVMLLGFTVQVFGREQILTRWR